MDLNRFLSLKDYFNYYISGWIWLINFILIAALFPDLLNWPNLFSNMLITNQFSSTVITTIIVLILPYTIGFALSGSGTFITKLSYRKNGDPVNLSIDGSIKSKRSIMKINNDILNQAEKLTNTFFEVPVQKFKQKPSNYFYLIRTYIASKSNTANDLANRALDLSVFAESLILPLAILAGIFSYYTVSSVILNYANLNISPLIAMALIYITMFIFAICTGLFVLKRHLKLREHWAKHVVRLFIVLGRQELEDRKSKDDKNTSK